MSVKIGKYRIFWSDPTPALQIYFFKKTVKLSYKQKIFKHPEQIEDQLYIRCEFS
jgi:hypothetical protein